MRLRSEVEGDQENKKKAESSRSSQDSQVVDL